MLKNGTVRYFINVIICIVCISNTKYFEYNKEEFWGHRIPLLPALEKQNNVPSFSDLMKMNIFSSLSQYWNLPPERGHSILLMTNVQSPIFLRGY